jgi:hypothetical protein
MVGKKGDREISELFCKNLRRDNMSFSPAMPIDLYQLIYVN